MAGIIYLDNAATTRVCDDAVQAAAWCMRDGYFNPSSVYAQALAAEKAMDACRNALYEATNLNKTGWVFTSGGTEANNLAILGVAQALRGKRTLITTDGEHPSVLEAMKATGHEVKILPLTHDGRVDLDAMQAALSPDVALLSVMHVNNETGAVNPIDEIRKLCPDTYLHVDGVQGFMRLKTPAKCDLYTVSGHKIHAPKGIGALYIAPHVKIKPTHLGGGQEKKLRAGTENTPGIAALNAAISVMKTADIERMRTLKTELCAAITSGIPDARVNGLSDAPHILSISLPPVGGEVMLHALEEQGLLISTGSACSAKKDAISHVLTAMRLDSERAKCSIRLSLSPYTTQNEIQTAAGLIISAYEKHRAFRRR